MNVVILKGNVGQDPRITNFDGGGKVVQFSLATTERGYTKKDGTKVEDKTEWHNIVVKNSGLAGVCEQYIKKGSSVLLRGSIQSREYTGNDGVKKYITEIVVADLELLRNGQKRELAPAPTPDGGWVSPGDDKQTEKAEDLPF